MRKRKQHREDKSQLIRVEDDDGLVGAGALDTSAMTQNYTSGASRQIRGSVHVAKTRGNRFTQSSNNAQSQQPKPPKHHQGSGIP